MQVSINGALKKGREDRQDISNKREHNLRLTRTSNEIREHVDPLGLILC